MKRVLLLVIASVLSKAAFSENCTDELPATVVGETISFNQQCPGGGSTNYSAKLVSSDNKLPANTFGGILSYEYSIQYNQCAAAPGVLISNGKINGSVTEFNGIWDNTTCLLLPSRSTDPVKKGFFAGQTTGEIVVNGKSVSAITEYSLEYGMPTAITKIGTSTFLDIAEDTFNATLSSMVLNASGSVYATPENGWWWNPSQSGRGFSIETKGENVFIAAYLYDATGRATWLAAGGTRNVDHSYTGEMLEYVGGQTLSGSYKPASVIGSRSNVNLTCSTSKSCTLTWAGGEMQLQRFKFDSAATAASPETGWWWNVTEGGRGYFLERQGNTLFAAGYMYDVSGNPIWLMTSGPMNGSTFQGSWSQFGNGQTISGTYVKPIELNSNVGSVQIQFSSATTATMTLPDGRQIQITRYPL